jgi:ATP-dependent Clp protease adaptor protein ClpS
MANTLETPTIKNDTDTGNILGRPHNVILFNDETHSMDEVIFQLMKATHCDAGKAYAIMMEAHNSGRAIAFSGGLERCELVEAILSEIQLGTKIEQA